MVNQNSSAIKEFSIPDFSIKYYPTVDNSLSAQFEHRILITDEKAKEPYEIFAFFS